MPTLTFEALEGEYTELWRSLEIRPSKAADIDTTAQKIIDAKNGRYTAVEKATGVPWFVVGVIHAMEAGCKFDRHLHNGDPLTARTRLVPAGRPKIGEPPFKWVESACDALLMKDLQNVSDWSIPRICFELERYNGWGYRKFHANTLSPYLWSGTNHYSRGKYVADGQWSATAVSGQSGAMAILKRIMELDAEVGARFASAPPPPQAADETATDPALEFPKAEQASAAASAENGAEIVGADVGFLSGRNFAKLNDLADQGSRVAGWLRSIKRWFWGTTTVATAGSAAVANTSTGTKSAFTQLVAAHPFLFVAIVGIIVAVAVYFAVKAVERYLLTAHARGDYKPRAG